MQFTPAGGSEQSGRSVTVAVRIDQQAARSIAGRSGDGARDAGQGLRIASTRYNLGLARGYQSFAKPTTAPSAVTGSSALANAEVPDLATFAQSAGMQEKPSRFATRVQVEEGDEATAAPRLARPSGQSSSDQTLDVAGSYRLTRNLDVTAGVRYSQERDRLTALPEIEEQDSRAVYIGTQFRF